MVSPDKRIAAVSVYSLSILIGLPGLGPDISFFRDLRNRQAARIEALMAAWTDPQRRRVAQALKESR